MSFDGSSVACKIYSAKTGSNEGAKEIFIIGIRATFDPLQGTGRSGVDGFETVRVIIQGKNAELALPTNETLPYLFYDPHDLSFTPVIIESRL